MWRFAETFYSGQPAAAAWVVLVYMIPTVAPSLFLFIDNRRSPLGQELSKFAQGNNFWIAVERDTHAISLRAYPVDNQKCRD